MSNVEKNAKGKWVATEVFDDIEQHSPPLKTKREANEWIMRKRLEQQIGDDGTRLMMAAIVKGLTEKRDGTAYFGSTLIYRHHLANAIKFGVVTSAGKVSKRGQEWYTRCLERLPQRRQVYWSASGGVGQQDPTIPATGGVYKPKS